MKKAIDYAKQLCDTLMRKFEAEKLPPEGHFHYHQGVFLSGMMKTYEVCREEKYRDYADKWIKSVISPSGEIALFDKNMLDDIQPGILLFDIYERTKDERYKKALDYMLSVVKGWKVNGAGGFWHKEYHPNQMWLDSLYMAGPIQAQYSLVNGDESYLNTAVKQIFIMYENMLDEKSGLLFHGWDYSKETEWADKETGLSDEVWGRALGWYVVAILDILSFMPENHPEREKIIEIEKNILLAFTKYQDSETGMWYQVVNKGDVEGNWVETSCSCLFAYALSKAVRMNVLDKSYLAYAIKGYEGVISSLGFDGEDLLIKGVCVGTDVCSFDDYISRPTSVNDLHGAGAFLLMCAEIALAQ